MKGLIHIKKSCNINLHLYIIIINFLLKDSIWFKCNLNRATLQGNVICDTMKSCQGFVFKYNPSYQRFLNGVLLIKLEVLQNQIWNVFFFYTNYYFIEDSMIQNHIKDSEVFIFLILYLALNFENFPENMQSFVILFHKNLIVQSHIKKHLCFLSFIWFDSYKIMLKILYLRFYKIVNKINFW